MSAELDSAILELAADLRAGGIVDAATYEKITARQLRQPDMVIVAPLTGAEIREMREQARMSQAVFARYLNLTPGYVSQLERGARPPTGPALVLLNVIRRHGMDMILA